MDDLILIGLPASGKTSAGRALARRLNMPFYDCDEAIEAALCRRERCVIATGGGAVLREENRLLLRRSGTVFWLDRPLEDIMSTNFQEGRPLLTEGRDALQRLAAARRALYAACAHHCIPEPLLNRAVADIENIWRGENV